MDYQYKIRKTLTPYGTHLPKTMTVTQTLQLQEYISRKTEDS